MTPDNIVQFWAALEIAKFLTSEGLRATVSGIRDFFSTRRGREVPRDVQTIFLTEEGAAFVATLLTISKEILDYVADEVERAEADYVECLREATSRGERNRCDRDAEDLICETLERAKKRNSGTLPPGFQPVWDRYSCA